MHPVAGPFQDTHLSKGCHALFSRRVLFLDTSSLTDSLGPILALGSVSMPRLWISLGNLKIPSSPGTVFTDAAFPRRASLPSERQLCHCKNRAAPIGTCLDGRQLAGRPGLAPNHNSKPGRPKPTCRRSRALAYPRECQVCRRHTAGTHSALSFEALYLALFLSCVFSLPCHIPGDLSLLRVTTHLDSRNL
jgi:hypothetical protein